MVEPLQKNYCYPQSEPPAKAKLNDYFHNLANYKGTKYSFEEHNNNMEVWLNEY